MHTAHQSLLPAEDLQGETARWARERSASGGATISVACLNDRDFLCPGRVNAPRVWVASAIPETSGIDPPGLIASPPR
jgi:hypothetical protein